MALTLTRALPGRLAGRWVALFAFVALISSNVGFDEGAMK